MVESGELVVLEAAPARAPSAALQEIGDARAGSADRQSVAMRKFDAGASQPRL